MLQHYLEFACIETVGPGAGIDGDWCTYGAHDCGAGLTCVPNVENQEMSECTAFCDLSGGTEECPDPTEECVPFVGGQLQDEHPDVGMCWEPG